MGRSPAASRRRLGMDLRSLREQAGLKIEDAAKRLDCSTAKVSRLENGKGVPYPRDVRDLVVLYGDAAQAHRAELLELVEDGRAQDWYSSFRDVIQVMSADHLTRFMELEQDAVEMAAFEEDLFPGLLQTEAYIQAICSVVFPDSSPQERKRFVEFRRERQKAVFSRGLRPRLNLVVHELAIVRQIGSAQVMREQLESLRADLAGSLSDVDFRLVPLRAEARGALGGPFVILKYHSERDQDLVYLEGREGATWLETDADVGRYGTLFAGLQQDCLSREDSLLRLGQVAEEFRQEVEAGG